MPEKNPENIKTRRAAQAEKAEVGPANQLIFNVLPKKASHELTFSQSMGRENR